MPRKLELNPDRLFSPVPDVRDIARTLYTGVKDLPIISPHGHTDPSWFALNEPFDNATDLLVKPDHYVFRMLYSQGVTLEELGIRDVDGKVHETDDRKIWHTFASHYHLFQGTPSRTWLDTVFADVFGIDVRLDAETADYYFDTIGEALKTEAFRPRALFERFNIELIATTEAATDDLRHHQAILDSDWNGRVVSTYRPDQVVDPEHEHFTRDMGVFGEITGEDVTTWAGYLSAHRNRRAYFKSKGVTATDHGHPSALTADLGLDEAKALFHKIIGGDFTAQEAEVFRAQMLTEFAGMSLEDGLVMQLHAGVIRNHNGQLFDRFGRDKGADIPAPTRYAIGLKPLLDKYGNNPDLTLILFTLDETAYARDLAPLAGHYPCLKLGPPWWFHDSPEGMRRFRQQMTETAGFYNTAGFNDDTRAFLSIPARHDVARRMDCNWLAELVADHRLDLDEARDLARDLAYNLAKQAYKL